MSEAEFGFRGKMTCLGIEFGNIYVVSTIEPDMIKICLAVVITEDKRVKRAYTTVDRADIIVGVTGREYCRCKLRRTFRWHNKRQIYVSPSLKNCGAQNHFVPNTLWP